MVLLISHPKLYSTQRILQECKNAGINVLVCPPEILLGGTQINIPDFEALLVRNVFVEKSNKALAAIISLARAFAAMGKPVIDEVIAGGKLALGKWEDYKLLRQAGVMIPETSLLMQTENVSLENKIVKWIYGMKARDVFYITRPRQTGSILKVHPNDEWLVQEYLPIDWEYKIAVVGYKALPVVVRFKTKQLGIVHASAEVLASSQLPAELILLAEKAARTLGREITKVDIAEANGRWYVLEVNRNPGLQNFEKTSRYNAFRDVVMYVKGRIARF